MIEHPTRVILAASLAGALALSACGQAPTANGNASPGSDPAGSDEQRYTATGTVLANDEHGPQLCGVVATSYPPQCGGLDIAGWDWSAVESQTEGDVQWGEYTVVGTWDGERLHLTEPPTPPEPPAEPTPGEPADEVTTPCEEPEGGWRPVDPDKTAPEDQQRAISRARSASDFAGAWLDPLGPGNAVLNLSFTGDLAAHRESIRETWGGPLCVSKAERSYAQLREIQQEIKDVPGFISGGIDEPGNVVRLEVYVATDELRDDLADRYGPEAVELTGFLRPVP